MILRRGVTLIELIIVLAIIGVLLGLLMPAVLSSREKAREAVCKSNLHQIALGLAQLHESIKRLPVPTQAGRVGGWSVEILPFFEQRALYDQISGNGLLGAVPTNGYSRPPGMRCPVTKIDSSNSPPIQASHFVLTPTGRRESWSLFDAPNGLAQPWLTGPEMEYGVVTRQPGPHRGGFHIAGSDGAVRLLINRRTVE